ncbi:hypothetical protein MKX03_000140, partial [Papaver bracteatum]
GAPGVEELVRVKPGDCFIENINWRVKGKLKIHKVVSHRRFKQKRFLQFMLNGMDGEGRHSRDEVKRGKKKEYR